MNSEKIHNLMKILPARPGIYKMLNATGNILYVWKSIHLKNRVSSYFNGKSKLNAAKIQMVEQVDSFEWIETSNEIEALVLETNLIKQHLPKYNILMKDDKNLSYIVFTGNWVEEVYRTRQKPNNGTFFWPYTSQANITQSVKTLRQIFKIRSCKMKFRVNTNTWHGNTTENPTVLITAKAGKTPPCMDYYIGLCPAPCLLTQASLLEHQENVDRLKKFLRGNMSEVIDNLKQKMMVHAKNLEFEEAAKIKEQVVGISHLGEKQIARDAISGNYDAVVILEKYGSFFGTISKLRNGEISGVFHTRIETQLWEEISEIAENFIARSYLEDISIEENWEEWYYSGKKATVLFGKETYTENCLRILVPFWYQTEVPEQGAKNDFLKFTKTNALNFAMRDEMEKLTKHKFTRSTMENILWVLGYEIPKNGAITFECYDNSHTDGHFTVAARTVSVNGKPTPDMYRKYKLKTLITDKIDDFESMREIMERRVIEGVENNNFPTLILIDGGKWQLSSALEWVERWLKKLEASGKNPIPLPYFASLAKREEEIFIPGQPDSFRFEYWSPELMLLQGIRDEAHRFSITFNRSLRTKSMKKNILEELPGFWPVTRKKLLKHAGSIDKIQEMSLQELQLYCTKVQIETLEWHGLWTWKKE
jgi:excinuclease ABC subunit C